MSDEVRPIIDVNGRRDHRARVVVKFRDDVQLPYEDDIEDEVEAADVIAWRDLAAAFPGIRLRRLFDEIPSAAIAAMVEEATARDDSYRPPNMLTYFVVTCPPQVDADEVAARLRGQRTVQEAYVEGGPTPPPTVNAVDDPRSVNQRYLDPAPDGIDAEYAWTMPGGDGAGIGFVDLEQGWTLGHEDLAAAGITVISGTSTAYHGHGTAVLGEVVAVDNAVGCVGIAPRATARVVSQYQPTGYNTAQAIVSAIGVMSFGDVLLLEAQTTVAGVTGYLPVEVEPAVFDAIRLASALGIVVVEAGGNGSNDLDSYVTSGGVQVLNRGAVGFRDSGAIMVGAASAATPHTPLWFTNHGSRIDCYAWGEQIDTTGDGWTGTSTTAYTTSFGGTSGASPIVTGAAILLQSVAAATHGFRFSPRQVRAMLADPATGTPSAAPATDGIGVMPNLRAIIDTVLGIRADLYLRDFVGDSGEAHTGAISASPDIILRSTAVANPQAAFGAGSGTENDATLGAEAEAGQDNYLYVRVLNQGGQAATNVTATVYWSPVSTLVTPNLWTLVGSTTIPNVPVGEVLTVSDAIVWPAAGIPGPGHYCFVGLVDHPTDPAPAPVNFLNWSNFETFIRNVNNVTWRNFNVVDNVPPAENDPPGFVPLEFLVAGAPDQARQFALEIVARLPEGAELRFEAPTCLIDPRLIRHRLLTRTERRDDDGERSCSSTMLKVAPTGRSRFDELQLAAGSTFRCRLLAAIPEELRAESFEVFARQLFEGREVGRVTWRLAPRRERR
jgi:serine protease